MNESTLLTRAGDVGGILQAVVRASAWLRRAMQRNNCRSAARPKKKNTVLASRLVRAHTAPAAWKAVVVRRAAVSAGARRRAHIAWMGRGCGG